MSFFDLLHSDALLNVLRFFSDTPRAANWISGISLSNILLLCRSGGPLRDQLLSNVTDISSWTRPRVINRPLVEEICQYFGDNATHLCLDRTLHFDIFTPVLVARLPSVKRLTLAPPYSDESRAEALLQVLGGKLEHLVADLNPYQERFYSTIANYCTALMHLSVAVSPENRQSVTAMLVEVGNNLQSLSLKVYDEQFSAPDLFLEYLFDQIAVLCPHVADLEIFYQWPRPVNYRELAL